ncbi:hypothetical protein ACHAXR_010747 [Thalassiosira sp. AJA248-18]
MISETVQKRKRSRELNNNNQKRRYRNVTFYDRPSSGRPGSPHRYFEKSYDVVFNGNSGEDSSPDIAGESQQSPSQKTPEPNNNDCGGGFVDDTVNRAALKQQQPCGNQVIHCHLNGLCIVTAGNVVLESIKKQGDGEGDHDSNEQKKELAISSIEYLVKVGKDSQSARGKMRTKNKRQKRNNAKEGGKSVEDHDGNVSPHDPLCLITLSDGTNIQLKCCVSGTIIELNHRLLNSDITELGGHQEGSLCLPNDDVNSPKEETEINKKAGNWDPSLILRDPLLDGHLAVIMPSKGGAFPPR